MKNLVEVNEKSLTAINGGGPIADWIEGLLCGLSCAEPGYNPDWTLLHGPKL